MDNKMLEIRLLNKDSNYCNYYLQALSFDNEHSWIIDLNLDEDLLFDLDETRLSSFTFGLFNKDELIGFSSISFECDDENEISFNISIIIKPKLRGNGIGSYFLTHILELIRNKYKMIKSLNATILTTNEASEHLFTNNGFVFNDFENINGRSVGNYVCDLRKNLDLTKEMSQN